MSDIHEATEVLTATTNQALTSEHLSVGDEIRFSILSDKPGGESPELVIWVTEVDLTPDSYIAFYASDEEGRPIFAICSSCLGGDPGQFFLTVTPATCLDLELQAITAQAA